MTIAARFAATLLLSSNVAAATDLRLYSGFAEVREPIAVTGSSYTLSLPQDAWNNMIPGTLALEGLKYSRAVQAPQSSWLASLEGKTVMLDDGGKLAPVTLVRARDLLIRDAQGYFRNVPFGQLRFTSAPSENPQAAVQQVVFTLPEPGSGRVSYLMQGLGWTPRYSLDATGETAALTALADIRNATAQSYDVNSTELLAGQVPILDGGPSSYPAGRGDFQSTVTLSTTSTINLQPTLNGLYRYSLSDRYTLTAGSTITLPFLKLAVSGFERFASVMSYFNSVGVTSSGVMGRSYRFRPSQNLPGGVVTLREDGRIVGQSSVPDTTKNGDISLTLGRDPDLSYTRTIETLTTTKNGGGTFKVTYTFTSNKDSETPAEVSEQIGGRKVLLDGVTTVNVATKRLRVLVPAHGTITQSYTVTINNDDN